MGGRTIRDALAVALEVVPGVELAAGDEMSRRALREYLLGWIKNYAFVRGVVFEDSDLEDELREVVGELRGVVTAPAAAPVDALEVECTICNSKPGQACTSVISSAYRQQPHARRIALALKGGA